MRNFLKTKKYWVVGMVFVTLIFILLPLTAEAQWWKCAGVLFGGSSTCLEYLTGVQVDGVIDATVASAVSFLTTVLFWFFGLFLRLAGMLMNWSIYLSINKMSDFLRIGGVTVAWALIRDVMNIAFIFGIVYIAIRTILGVAGQEIKKFLSSLVLAAILVNFSFFLTGAVIDASNIITLQIYDKIINLDVEGVEIITNRAEEFVSYDEEGNLDSDTAGNEFFILDSGMAGIFMKHSQITSIFNTEFGELTTTGTLMTALFGSIFIFMLTFVFLTVAALLLLRLVVLILLVITSPIAFLGMVFPNMSEHSTKWRKALFDQALFAPAYMLMSLVVILVISSPELKQITKNDSGATMATAINAGFQTGTMGVVVNYLIVIGLTIGSLIMAKKFSSGGGGIISEYSGKASGYVDKLRGRALTPIKATGRFATEQTKGRVVGGVRQFSAKVGEDIQKDKPQTRFGRFIGNLPETGRRVPVVGGVVGAVGGLTRAGLVKAGAEAGKATRQSLKEREGQFSGLSDNAIKRMIGAITTTPEDRAAGIAVLAGKGKGNLVPENGLTEEMIRTGAQRIRESGGDTKDIEGKLLYQYAESGHEVDVDEDGKVTHDPDKMVAKKLEKVIAAENMNTKAIQDMKSGLIMTQKQIIEKMDKQAAEKGWSNTEKTAERIKLETEQTAIKVASFAKHGPEILTAMTKRDDNMDIDYMKAMTEQYREDKKKGKDEPITREDLADWLETYGEVRDANNEIVVPAEYGNKKLAGVFKSKKLNPNMANLMAAVDVEVGTNT